MNIYQNDSIDTSAITPYVYKLTNKITNQFYYGYRRANVRLKLTPKNDLWKVYFSSSKDVKPLLFNMAKIVL